MTEYLVAIHLPDDYDTNAEAQSYRDDISALNREMVAAGVRKFVGGLKPVREAVAIRARSGAMQVTDGPYLETKEHIGGFWVLELNSMDEAIAWGRRAAIACRAPVEVREFGAG